MWQALPKLLLVPYLSIARAFSVKRRYGRTHSTQIVVTTWSAQQRSCKTTQAWLNNEGHDPRAPIRDLLILFPCYDSPPVEESDSWGGRAVGWILSYIDIYWPNSWFKCSGPSGIEWTLGTSDIIFLTLPIMINLHSRHSYSGSVSHWIYLLCGYDRRKKGMMASWQ